MLRSVLLWMLAVVFVASLSPDARALPVDGERLDSADVKVAKRRRKNTKAEDAENGAGEDAAPDEIAPDAAAFDDDTADENDADDAETSDRNRANDDARASETKSEKGESGDKAKPAASRTKLTSREIADTVLPSVVTIIAERRGRVVGQGSGFFVGKDLVATNFHVIAKADAVYIALPEYEDEDEAGIPFDGIAALTPDVDLVLLKVSDEGDFKKPALGLANETAQPGDPIFAVGTPQGLTATFSDGMVSSVRGEEKNILQITAPISAGSSGGPIVDEYGEVAGVVVAKHTGGDNLGFAIATKELTKLLANQQDELVDFSDAEDRLDEILDEREAAEDGGDSKYDNKDGDDYENYEEEGGGDDEGIGIGWWIGGICGVCGVCGACSAGTVGVCVGLQCFGIVLGSLGGGGGGGAAVGAAVGALGLSAVGSALALAGVGLTGYTALHLQSHGQVTPTTLATGGVGAAALVVGTLATLAGGAVLGASLLAEEGEEDDKKPAREYGPVKVDVVESIAH